MVSERLVPAVDRLQQLVAGFAQVAPSFAGTLADIGRLPQLVPLNLCDGCPVRLNLLLGLRVTEVGVLRDFQLAKLLLCTLLLRFGQSVARIQLLSCLFPLGRDGQRLEPGGTVRVVELRSEPSS